MQQLVFFVKVWEFHTTGDGKAVLAVLELAQVVLEHGPGGVARARVVKLGARKTLEGGGHVDGRGGRAVLILVVGIVYSGALGGEAVAIGTPAVLVRNKGTLSMAVAVAVVSKIGGFRRGRDGGIERSDG